MKNKTYLTVRTVPKSYRKIAEKRKINTPNTYIHEAHFHDFVQTLL